MITPEPVHVEALASALIAFLWQGALLAVATAFLMRAAPAAQARYLIGVTGLLAMLASPIVTYSAIVSRSATAPPTAERLPAPGSLRGTVTGLILIDDARRGVWLEGTPGPETGAASPRQRHNPVNANLPSTAHATGNLANENRRNENPANYVNRANRENPVNPIIVTIWLAGVTFLALRLLGGWVVARRLARRVVGPADVRLQALAADVARRLNLTRGVAIVESAAVAVPTVVGWVKPVVLMPVCGLSGLSMCQLEAILAHELAHVGRHDYLVNLLQSAVETLLFYHPAVWWLSRRVRAEREHCCDDLAVEVCGDRLVYVSALAELAALDAAPRLALAATDGSLLSRVARLLGEPPTGRTVPPASLALALLLLGSTLAAFSGSASLLSTGPAGQPEEAMRPLAAPDVARAARLPADSPTPAAPPSDRNLRQALPQDTQPPSWHAPEAPPVPSVPPAPPAPPEPPTPAPPLAALEAPIVYAPIVATVPAVPAAPAIPSAPAPSASEAQGAVHESSANERGTLTWSTGSERFRLEWTGRFTLTDDDRNVASVENGASVKLAEGRLFTTRVELQGLPDGRIERRFYRNGFERPYEPEGRAWLESVLPRLVERSSLFAEQRVSRLLEAGGAEAVLAVIDRLPADASYVRRRYYQELLEQAPQSAGLLTLVTERVQRDALGDYDRAQVLTRVAASAAATDAARAAVAAASRSIRGDYEQSRVLTAAMDSPLSEPVATAVLGAASDLGGDYERSRILAAVAAGGGVTAATSERYLALAREMRSAYEQQRALSALAKQTALTDEATTLRAIQAAGSVPSDYERRRVLQLFLVQREMTPPLATAALQSAASLESSHERALVLKALIDRGGLTEETASAFFAAAAGLSSYEHRRVLEAAMARPLSASMLVALIGNTGRISGEYDRATILRRLAEGQTLSPEARARYLDVADTLRSEYEQTRALAALVRAERRSGR